jgi:hypothetical protein
MASAQIVQRNRLITGCGKSLAGMAADITSSAGDQDL